MPADSATSSFGPPPHQIFVERSIEHEELAFDRIHVRFAVDVGSERACAGARGEVAPNALDDRDHLLLRATREGHGPAVDRRLGFELLRALFEGLLVRAPQEGERTEERPDHACASLQSVLRATSPGISGDDTSACTEVHAAHVIPCLSFSRAAPDRAATARGLGCLEIVVRHGEWLRVGIGGAVLIGAAVIASMAVEPREPVSVARLEPLRRCRDTLGVWTLLPEDGLFDLGANPFVTARGNQLLVLGQGGAAALDLRRSRWEPLATEAMRVSMTTPYALWERDNRIAERDWLLFPYQVAFHLEVQAYALHDHRWHPPLVLDDAFGATPEVIAWTGHELLVWAGRVGARAGARVNPRSRTIARMGAGRDEPSDRHAVGSVWAKDRLFVWGGVGDDSPFPFLSTGALYDPATDTWVAVSSVGAPSPRASPHVHWTGSKVIVFAGSQVRPPDESSGWPQITQWFDGGIYDPQSDRWEPIPSFAPEVTPLRPNWIGFDDDRVIVLASDATLHVYDPQRRRWATLDLPDPLARPLEATEVRGSVRPGRLWLLPPGPNGAGGLARLDPTHLRWAVAPLPPNPLSVDALAWADGCLVEWGTSTTGRRVAAMITPAFEEWPARDRAVAR